MKTAQVIGAGFTGLIAAYFLQKSGFTVTVIDRKKIPGGMIQTLPISTGDIETAANGFLATALLEDISDRIGVRLIPASKLAKKNRWLCPAAKNGELSQPRKWPLTYFETLAFLFRFLWNYLTRRLAPHPGETLENWGNRTLGSAATHKLLEVVVLGIYAAPISELSASLTIGRFFKKRAYLRKSRSRGTVAPEHGMSQWFLQLKSYLEKNGVQFLTLDQPPLTKKDLLNFDFTAICTSAPDAAKLLDCLSPEVAKHLEQIEMLPIISITGTSKSLNQKYRGFGCLFHRQSGYNSLGALWSSDIFPHRFKKNSSSETWILGGSWNPELITKSNEDLIQQVESDRFRLGRIPALECPHIVRWPQAFPKYSIRLEKTLSEMPTLPENVFLFGNYLGNLGLSQMALNIKNGIDRLL